MTVSATPGQGGVSAADAPTPTYVGRWVSARIGSDFLTVLDARTHGVLADEPIPLGGSDLGMTPYELLLASLSSCMAMTMRMYANRKRWLTLSLTDEQHTRLVEIADRCPIKRNLEAGLEVVGVSGDVP